MSRRRFLGGVSIVAVGTFGYARFFEAERLQVSHHTVPLGGGARRPLKLLHLSDLHASGVVGLDYIESAMDRALAWRPEVICLTGDFNLSQSLFWMQCDLSLRALMLPKEFLEAVCPKVRRFSAMYLI